MRAWIGTAKAPKAMPDSTMVIAISSAVWVTRLIAAKIAAWRTSVAISDGIIFQSEQAAADNRACNRAEPGNQQIDRNGRFTDASDLAQQGHLVGEEGEVAGAVNGDQQVGRGRLPA